MNARRGTSIAGLLIGMVVFWTSGCTAEDQAAATDSLASAAGTAASALINFAVDFARQGLAAFLF